MDSDTKKIFTEEEMKNFAGLYDVLEKVHIRLMKEGYKIENGKIIPPKLSNKK